MKAMKYVLTNAVILDGTENMQPQTGRDVVIADGKITDIVPAGKVPSGYEVIDIGGKYLMPGLINMHVHLAGNGKPQNCHGDCRLCGWLCTASVR